MPELNVDLRRQVRSGSNYALKPDSGGTGRTDAMAQGYIIDAFCPVTALAYGDLAVLDSSYVANAGLGVKKHDGDPSNHVIGVVLEPGGIPYARSGSVLVKGFHPAVNVTGSNLPYQVLWPSTTAGKATTTPGPNGSNLRILPIGRTRSSGVTTIMADIDCMQVVPSHGFLQLVAGIKRHVNLLETATITADVGSPTEGQVGYINDNNTTLGYRVSTYARGSIQAINRAGGYMFVAKTSDNNGGTNNSTLQLRGTNDSTWATYTVVDTRVHAVNGNLAATGSTHTAGFPTSAAFRYWALVWTDKTNSLMYEWELYEAAGQSIYATEPTTNGSNMALDTLLSTYCGVHQITANGSNALQRNVNLVAGANIALGVSGQDITISSTGGGGGGGGAPTSARYYVAEADGTLSNETVISGIRGWSDVDVAGADDDEFTQNASGTPSGWSDISSGAADTINTTARYSHLYMMANAGASLAWKGVYKSLPGGTPTLTLRVTDFVSSGQYNAIGFFIGESGSTGKLDMIEVQRNGATSFTIVGELFTNRTTYSTTWATSMGIVTGRPPLWFRIKYNSATSIDYWFSFGGLSFTALTLARNPGFTPAIYGIGVKSENATYAQEAYFDWVRKT